MGHVQKRGDRKYQARWLDPEGRERAQTFTRKIDAERHLTSVEGAKLASAYVDQTNKITVSEYAKQWAAARPHRASTAARTATLIKTHIEAIPLGSRRLVAVRPSEVQAWRRNVLGGSHRALCGSWLARCAPSSMQPFGTAWWLIILPWASACQDQSGSGSCR